MRREPWDRRARERNAASILTSLILHGLAALLLFSLATSSSEQSAPESNAGAIIVTVSKAAPKKTAPAPVKVARAAPPVPHAPVIPRPRIAAKPKSAPPHPRVLHVLAKFAPTAPPNPTPAPVSTAAPNPVVTRAPISVTPAPLPAAVPTTAPAQIAAVSIRVPPTAAPTAKPKPLPSQAPTPAPEPSALEATAAPLVAVATPQPLLTPGSPLHVAVATPQPAATAGQGTAPTPGPKPVASAGPKGIAPVQGPQVARPIQTLPATPPPVTSAGHPSRRQQKLNQRLQNLIPTPAPAVSPEGPKHYSFLNVKTTPEPEPTPPADVIAATKFLYVENVGQQKWKQSWLGTAPEERYVKMYVTGVKRIGFIKWCTGWVLRSPEAGASKWIVEPNESLICSGHLDPFTQPSPEPPNGS